MNCTLNMEKSKIISEKLEINVTNMCNLSCRGCSHLSPICTQHTFDIDKLRSSLDRLNKVFHCQTVRLLGGEPFLVANLPEIIDVVRKSNICNSIAIVSNGLLINEKHNQILQSIDVLEISDHHVGVNVDYIATLAKGKCKLQVLDFEAFRESYSEKGTNDTNLIEQIYKTCLISQIWKCYNLEDGHFYKCPQAHVLKSIKNLLPDGVNVLLATNLKDDLQSYINSECPLSACKYCLSGVGNLFKQQQINRKIWRKQQNRSTEDMLDYEFLDRLKTKANSDNHCVKSIVSKEK